MLTDSQIEAIEEKLRRYKSMGVNNPKNKLIDEHSNVTGMWDDDLDLVSMAELSDYLKSK